MQVPAEAALPRLIIAPGSPYDIRELWTQTGQDMSVFRTRSIHDMSTFQEDIVKALT